MSDYTDLDAGISRELAHRIEAIWNSDKTQNGLEIANTKLRDNLDTDIHNADQDRQRPAPAGPRGKRQGRQPARRGRAEQNRLERHQFALLMPNADPVAAEASILPQMSGALQRKMELTDEYLKTLEARANIKLNEIKEHKMDEEDQADFRLLHQDALRQGPPLLSRHHRGRLLPQRSSTRTNTRSTCRTR
jgi:hypothetical protein